MTWSDYPTSFVEDGAIQLAAAGDLKCTGGYCRSGGTYGTTAMYIVNRKPVCRDCAVKLLGFENLPARERTDALKPYLNLGR
jgi:hypothetical protein